MSPKTSDTPTEAHAGHPAQKAQEGGCCGGHEHSDGDAAIARDGLDTEQQADSSAKKAQGGCGCGC